MSQQKVINRFGREYHLQETSDNQELIKQLESNWKKIGHYTMKLSNKENSTISLYASRFKK
jgi:hypothetical protein